LKSELSGSTAVAGGVLVGLRSGFVAPFPDVCFLDCVVRNG